MEKVNVKHSDVISSLNLLNCKIQISESQINKIEILLKYWFVENKYGERKNCGSKFEFRLTGDRSMEINMSNNLAKSFSEFLKIALEEEKEVLNNLHTEYNTLLSTISK